MAIEAAELKERLLQIAYAEALDEFVADQGIVALANRLGIGVSITFGEGRNDRHALLRFGQPPRISLFRTSTQSRTLEVEPSDERRLKTHERFSVGHEIGHWLARERLGVEPIEPTAARSSEYWKHESAMHAFAGAILVPRHVIARSMEKWPAGVHFPAKSLHMIARDLRVSRIVAACQIAAHRTDFGYLELQFQRDPQAPRLLLVVKESASSSDLKLPGTASKVRNDRLVGVLRDSHSGQRHLGGLSFDGKKIYSLNASWCQIAGVPGEGASGEASWVGRMVMSCWSKDDIIDVFIGSG